MLVETHPVPACGRSTPPRRGMGTCLGARPINQRRKTMPTSKKTTTKKPSEEVIRFAKNAMRHHMDYLKDHIFNEVEQDEKLSAEYLNLLEKRNKGKQPAKKIDELREEIWTAIQNVFMVNGLLHDWPKDGRNEYLVW
jgi:hypothetical protein